jgi:hypothetical protein
MQGEHLRHRLYKLALKETSNITLAIKSNHYLKMTKTESIIVTTFTQAEKIAKLELKCLLRDYKNKKVGIRIIPLYNTTLIETDFNTSIIRRVCRNHYKYFKFNELISFL